MCGDSLPTVCSNVCNQICVNLRFLGNERMNGRTDAGEREKERVSGWVVRCVVGLVVF